MDDKKIIELFWERRKEDALTKTAEKYGGLCHYIAGNILKDPKDCEECVNDAYLSLWNAIPPQRPNRFSVFLGRIVKNLSLKRFAYVTAAKRNPGAVSSLEELCECVSGKERWNLHWKISGSSILLDKCLWQQPVRNAIFLCVAIGIWIPLTLLAVERDIAKAK